MAALDIRIWLARALRSKLSTRVTVLFVAAFIVPWCAYAWLMTTERAAQVERTEQSLAALAAAYGQHVATLLKTAPSDDTSWNGFPASVENEASAFRDALNIPGVTFSLRPLTAPETANGSDTIRDLDGMIVVEVRPDSVGFVASASMSEVEALNDWSAGAYTQAIALMIRSFFVVGVGWFLVRQLRWRETHQRDLIAARDKAESASRAKSEFLANMSHELRTPLNAIIGFAEIIKNRTFGATSERYSDYAGDIHKSGTHLLSLINDILNLSKLEAGKFQLQEQDVDVAAIVEASMLYVQGQARQADIRISVSLDPEVRFIRADERRLQQVLISLLSNAVKFSLEGGHVRVASNRRGGGLAITVSDTGIGIAPEDIPKALAPFGQIERKVRRKQEGTGLGLPLAKQLVELHGGTFSIESAVNVGTTVTFLLPPSRVVASMGLSPPVRATG